MDVGPTLAKGHPQSLDHGCNVRSTCRCSVYPAIHTTTRSLLRSSSTHEPSDPPLRVVSFGCQTPRGRRNLWVWDRVTRQKARQSGGGGRHPRKWTFRRPVDGPVRGRPVAAPWTRHGGRGRFPWHPPHRGLTGPRSPRPPLTETRGSAADWGRPAGAEGSSGDGTPTGTSAAEHGTQGRVCCVTRTRRGHVNDPSAGSPTETLLRLLLPLNDQVWTCFRQLEATKAARNASPEASLNHSIGSSDGRCVQRAGT